MSVWISRIYLPHKFELVKALKLMDYYEILGVSPNAETAVISAAYKALTRIYHPDIYTGDKEYALKRSKELNKAWEVLSKPESRRQHDQKAKSKQSADSNTASGNARKATDSKNPDHQAYSQAVKEEWDFAAFYYTDLDMLHSKLIRIDSQLGFLFQAYLVERKSYKERKETFIELRDSYLREKFGSNANVRGLALASIEENSRGFAIELNPAIKRLGESDIGPILKKLGEQYPNFAHSSYSNFGFSDLKPNRPDVSEDRNKVKFQSSPQEGWHLADWAGFLGLLILIAFFFGVIF